MWYRDNIESLFSELGSTSAGLSSEEAGKRLLQYGENCLATPDKKGFIRRFLGSLCDRMTVVLLVASAISFVTSYISGEGYADPIIILLIVLINGFIATVQESRAEKSLEALKKLTSPENTVLRDGRPIKIPAKDIVRGDIILLEKGDIVPCDARLTESNSLTVDESALTGESAAVAKDHRDIPDGNRPISEIKSCVFTSTHIISGRARAVAVKTGMQTCVGEIAGMISGETEKTPLQKRLARLSSLLGNITVAICALIFVFSVFKEMDIGDMFMTSVSLSVAAIPEGLPAIVTVVLSTGVQTMARQKAVVKRLPAVETLGCAQVICSDKTGTLTCNKMTVEAVYGERERLMPALALCNNDSSPTELALTEYCPDCEELRARFPRLQEIPFDSAKKYMVTVNRAENGYLVYMKGAPDVVAGFCREGSADIARVTAEMSENALRVICFAGRFFERMPENILDCGLDFLGLCGISDPIRPEAREAVALCKKAGIRTVMLTGDHKGTARAVAIKLGMISKNDTVYCESELSSLSDRELAKKAEKCNVFARVTPAFKLRIVNALRSRGYVVAMTGDGVNDAPALKRADIGCAMGISGTEVAKESADMILTDDNFATVVSAVREGRGIYENIRRAVHFLLSCNIGELFTVFFSIMLSLPSPLSAIQLLWVNLTTDSLPAIALGLERVSDDAMSKPPIKPDSPLFDGSRIARIIFEGILIGSLAITAFSLGCARAGREVGGTMCFLVLGVSQLFHSFNMRSERSVFSRSVKKNRFVWLSFFVCICMQSGVILIPAARTLFSMSALTASEWIISLLLSVCPLVLCEIYKAITKNL